MGPNVSAKMRGNPGNHDVVYDCKSDIMLGKMQVISFQLLKIIKALNTDAESCRKKTLTHSIIPKCLISVK